MIYSNWKSCIFCSTSVRISFVALELKWKCHGGTADKSLTTGGSAVRIRAFQVSLLLESEAFPKPPKISTRTDWCKLNTPLCANSGIVLVFRYWFGSIPLYVLCNWSRTVSNSPLCRYWITLLVGWLVN